jgi:hypothetical protein
LSTLRPSDDRSEFLMQRGEAASRLKRWTRSRFALAGELAILVTELAGSEPGFPPRSTVVAFWIAERHYHFRVFKPLLEVTEDDLPPAWYRDALAVPEGLNCGCC